MTRSCDVVLIGGGHNGLICAAYLARAGRKVLVLERGDQVGGMAITEELAPGARASIGAHICPGIQKKIVNDLDLEAHGLEMAGPRLKTIALGAKGQHLTIDGSTIVGDLSDADRLAYTDFQERLEAHARALAPQLLTTPPRLARAGFANAKQLAKMGWDIRIGLGRDGMRDFLRIAAMNIHGLVDEVFESESLKALIAFDATLGTGYEPRMPNTALTYLYRLALGLDQQMSLPKGGMGSVTAALCSAAESAGAEIQCGSAVTEVLLEKGRAVGVKLADGSEIQAGLVVSNADPRTTFFDLVGARHLEAGFAHRLGNYRAKGRTAKVNLVLKGLPEFTGLSADDLAERLVIAPSRRYLELAFNPSKYGDLPEVPALEVTLPSARDPNLTEGEANVLSAVVQHVPYEASGEAAAGAVLRSVLAVLEVYAPGIGDLVSNDQVLLPKDLEERFGVFGGHWHHGDMAIDQMFMMRPLHGCAQYKTPIDGLYLCGAGAHPGGGVMGAPGHNAAASILAGGAG